MNHEGVDHNTRHSQYKAVTMKKWLWQRKMVGMPGQSMGAHICKYLAAYLGDKATIRPSHHNTIACKPVITTVSLADRETLNIWI